MIERENLKRNILKETIIRVDFEGVLPVELDNILLKSKAVLKENGFNQYKNEENLTNNMTGVVNNSFLLTHLFENTNKGYSIRISCNFLVLTIHSNGYTPYEEYVKLFVELFDIYKENVDFLSLKRFGFRKNNFCYIKDYDKINKYFSPNYFSLNEPIDGYLLKIKERREKLEKENLVINLIYTIKEEEIENEKWYKVIVDSDIYTINSNVINNIMGNNEEFKEVNETLFNLFVKALTDDFVDILSSDKNIDSNELKMVSENG